jgi:hypothetical protein
MRRFIFVAAAILLMTTFVHAKVNPIRAFVPGDQFATVEVLALDDPANPYVGRYSAMDQWAYDNYCGQISDLNYQTYQMSASHLSNSSTELRDRNWKVWVYRSVVEVDSTSGKASLVPFTERKNSGVSMDTLGDILQGNRIPDSDAHNFWSYGIVSPELMESMTEQSIKQLASVAPKVASWMVSENHLSDICILLPDGGIIYATPENPETQNRAAKLSRYDASGTLLDEANTRDYLNWREIMLWEPLDGTGPQSQYFKKKEHYSENEDGSKKLIGISNNSISVGRYTAFRNEDGSGYVGVIDHWQKQKLEGNQLNDLPLDDYPYFNQTEYQTLLAIYNAQQGN